ncbi:hypothetical protein [Polymorphum gilvum]|uniref:Lipoprotein n=1 Tax=Polymorphum gilvum (strain LMG 25793 / CGMCC 1.9160 / SL003B-26A1) TaxID=991905 RepID=F2J4E2_POLGS|nr:hypothetical protein [Polymorphum gilvum]ADZ71084.1 hypothetical protein SL003B_2661 [Polymorphum gilvum SL003B-26A1]
MKGLGALAIAVMLAGCALGPEVPLLEALGDPALQAQAGQTTSAQTMPAQTMPTQTTPARPTPAVAATVAGSPSPLAFAEAVGQGGLAPVDERQDTLMNEDERAAALARLQALSESRRGAAAPAVSATARDLARIGATHGQAALSEIEAD